MIFENVNPHTTRQAKNQEESILAGKHLKVILGEVKYKMFVKDRFCSIIFYRTAKIGIN